MLEWMKHFLAIPLSYVAALATIIFLAVEILTLTTWNLLKRGRSAAHTYYKLIGKPPKKPYENPYVIVGVLVAAYVAYTIYTKKKG